MNKLPNDWHWNEKNGSDPWYTSHGSPTVKPGSIFMWSVHKIGEGMNLKYSFEKSRKYCVETLFSFTNNGA